MSSAAETTDTALLLAHRFELFGQIFRRWLHSQKENGTVTPARLRLLGALHCMGPQIMSNLGEQLGVTARNVTALVDALESEGLVRRTPHSTDRRATVIELTTDGAAAAGELVEAFRQKIAGLFRDLPDDDQRQLLRLVDSLLVALQKRVHNGRG
jgi:DNA-binding MarR family transcriptional regulator